MAKRPPPAPTASAIGPCPTIILVGRPGTGSLLRTIAPPDHPSGMVKQIVSTNYGNAITQTRVQRIMGSVGWCDGAG